ncbi:NAD-dependent epimerase/dehydratase family protein [Sulfidibacter corallicola]|uniref:NAD-dependent epimerase/dehydratase family protein n=1 Tax=Sulfidibacter corallicola TaxID=2818388 RepID=A0A8A4TYL9_SULCO|nr:NAD-dependent epimerase/dehydratase family protein [Sulfidibacter corallicola]QTD54042.1 NAD-dependent epimerase/dehydratase family protein [Sulfidibacter corallicola]
MADVLITGANGEIGHSLIQYLAEEGRYQVVGCDLREPSAALSRLCSRFYTGDILDSDLIAEIHANHCFDKVFHLAGLLSSSGERDPYLAHDVNVNGSINIMKMAQEDANRTHKPVVFVFTSSIAVYGLQQAERPELAVREHEHLAPATMYGINKLYIEQLGRYFGVLNKPMEEARMVNLDFRCLRFPGVISAETVPSGGTSDFGPEMLHAAASGQRYDCFVKPETRLPFMVMQDAVKALLDLSRASRDRLTQQVYNVNAFSVTAAEIRDQVLRAFPGADIGFDPTAYRQAIVDGWPRDVDDSPARNDWGWEPDYPLERAFDDLLVPAVKRRYGS